MNDRKFDRLVKKSLEQSVRLTCEYEATAAGGEE